MINNVEVDQCENKISKILCLAQQLEMRKMGTIMIRKAELKDIPAVMDIYNDATYIHTNS